MPGEGVRVGGAWPVTVARRAATLLSFPLEVPAHRPAHSLAMGPTDIMKDIWGPIICSGQSWEPGMGAAHTVLREGPLSGAYGAEDFEIIILSI